MMLVGVFSALLWAVADAATIQVLECSPPDRPIWGGYGPIEDYYSPGDVIHYYCAVDTFIGGNYRRICEDTGAWSGDTPVCDAPSTFSSTSQSSDADEASTSELAVDRILDSCSKTLGLEGGEWSGTFTKPGQLLRVMLFLPRGQVSYEVVLVKENGAEVVCGSETRNKDHQDWSIHNCREPDNTGAAGLKIRSLSNVPLQICEVRAFVLTSPKCTDPRMPIESGHLRLNRKSAVLVCNNEFNRSPETQLDCVREGVWNRKLLYCSQRDWDDGVRETSLNIRDQGRNTDREREKLTTNTDRERERLPARR